MTRPAYEPRPGVAQSGKPVREAGQGSREAGRGPSGLLLLRLGDLTAYVVHVEAAHGLDQLCERRRGQRPGLAEDHDPVAERHQRGDRGDLERSGEALLVLGVDAGEGDVGVGLRRLLVDRCEHPARPAPRRPEVDQDDAVLGHDLLEVLLGQGCGGHAALSPRKTGGHWWKAFECAGYSCPTWAWTRARSGGAQVRAQERDRRRIRVQAVGPLRQPVTFVVVHAELTRNALLVE